LWGQVNAAFHHQAGRLDQFIVLLDREQDKTWCMLNIQTGLEDMDLADAGLRHTGRPGDWKIDLVGRALLVDPSDISLSVWAVLDPKRFAAEATEDLRELRGQVTDPAGRAVWEDAQVDLHYRSVTPSFEMDWSFLGKEQEHYQENGVMSGSVRIADRTYSVHEAHTSHDRSWGVRDWLVPEWWYFGMGSLEEDIHFHFAVSRLRSGELVQSGFIYREQGETEWLDRVEVEHVERAPQGYVSHARFTLAAGQKEWTVSMDSKDGYRTSVHREAGLHLYVTETLMSISLQDDRSTAMGIGGLESGYVEGE
jgi:hypothetical protein